MRSLCMILKSRIWSTLIFATLCVILRSRALIMYVGACYTRGAAPSMLDQQSRRDVFSCYQNGLFPPLRRQQVRDHQPQQLLRSPLSGSYRCVLNIATVLHKKTFSCQIEREQAKAGPRYPLKALLLKQQSRMQFFMCMLMNCFSWGAVIKSKRLLDS